MPRILFIDDYYDDFAQGLKEKFSDSNVLFQKTPNIREINKKIEGPPKVDVVLLDVLFEYDEKGNQRSAEAIGGEVLKKIKQKHDVPVLILTTTARETDASYPQASGIIQKPKNTSDETFYNTLFTEISLLTEIQQADWDQRFGFIVGNSPKMIEAAQSIVRFAKYHPASIILVTGETGTGKEEVCRAIHKECGFNSNDGSYQVVHCGKSETRDFKINLGGFPPQPGAQRVIGVLEILEGLNWQGTLLFDEIDDLNLECQNLLNRLLQGDDFQQENNPNRVFSPGPDLRFLFTAQKNIAQLVSEGSFRKDLWRRIEVHIIGLPPLRERMEIIPQLYEFYVKEFSPGKDSYLKSELKAKLKGYHWPGNIGEFKNVIQRAIAQTSNSPLRPEDIDFTSVSSQPTGSLISRENIGITVEKIMKGELGLQEIDDMGINRVGDLMQKILKLLIEKIGPQVTQKSLAEHLKTTVDIVKQILSKNKISLVKAKKAFD